MLYNPAPPAGQVTTGNYTGNDAADRGIPHGCTQIPKKVQIIADGAGRYGFTWYDIIGLAYILSHNHGTKDTVTAPDATNFYVGHARTYIETANEAGIVYRWFAIW